MKTTTANEKRIMRRFILQFPYCYFLIIYHSCSSSSSLLFMYPRFSVFNRFSVCFPLFRYVSFHVADSVYSRSVLYTFFFLCLLTHSFCSLCYRLLCDCCCCYCCYFYWSCTYRIHILFRLQALFLQQHKHRSI